MLLCCRISVSGANFPCTQGLILLESVLHNWHQRDIRYFPGPLALMTRAFNPRFQNEGRALLFQ